MAFGYIYILVSFFRAIYIEIPFSFEDNEAYLNNHVICERYSGVVNHEIQLLE